MKKSTLFLFFAIVISTANAQTSVYHPFPDSDAIWNTNLAGGIGPCVHDQFSYTLAGDTTINGNAFHKVVIPYILAEAGCLPYINAVYVGCIRQDTAARRVYVIQPADTTQYLLYDFTLTTGDVAPAVRSFCEETIIKNVDSVLVDGSYRKRWLVGDSTDVVYSYRIIEGIGATSNLLNPCCNRPDLPIYSLTCFQQNGMTLYYANSQAASCDLIAAIQNDPEKNISVFISPNPFHVSARLVINTESAEMKIYNVFGKLVRQETINNYTTIINRKTLADGMYFYQLINKNGQIANGKFILN